MATEPTTGGEEERGKRLTKAEYDPAIMDVIIERWRATHHKRASAQAAGVCEDTLANYLARGEAGEPLFSEFSVRFKKAESDWITERCLIIRKAAMEEGQWQAGAWDLERHLPDEFGRKERLGIGQDPTAAPVGIATTAQVALALSMVGEAGEAEPDGSGPASDG